MDKELNMEFLMEIGNVMMFNGRDSMQNVVMDMDSLSLSSLLMTVPILMMMMMMKCGGFIDDEMRWVY